MNKSNEQNKPKASPKLDKKNDVNELKGKSKKAKQKLISINSKTTSILKKLDKIREILKRRLKIVKSEHKKKCRSMIHCIPNRIEFEEEHLKFYIDFTVTCQESENPLAVSGSIIYGTSKTMCFTECPSDWCNIKKCQRLVRCDHLEDKPLIEFMVGDDGYIRSSGILEDEWVFDDEEQLTELHLRTLVIIWKDALDWLNEKLIP